MAICHSARKGANTGSHWSKPVAPLLYSTSIIIIHVFLFVLVGGALVHSADDSVGQWILATPPAFRPALAPLIEHRQTEGFKVVVLETTDVLSQGQLHQRDGTLLQARLNELFQHYHGRSCLLLAGICGTAGLTNAENAVVPSLRGAIGRMKGEASDLSNSGLLLPPPQCAWQA